METMKQARTCNRCRAVAGNDRDLHCDLGYRTLLWNGAAGNYIVPREPCPKPLTVLQHCQAPKKQK